jgi:hypothetical protein
VRPPSVERARVPFGPTAKTSDGDTARMRVNCCERRRPTADQVTPASGERTVVPSSPTATALRSAPKLAASSFLDEGLTLVSVPPPSLVRMSEVPVWVVKMQVNASAHRTDERNSSPVARCSQVAPPSLVRSTDPVPTAYPTVGVTKWTPFTPPANSRTSVHDSALSVVRYSRPWAVAATPSEGLVKETSRGANVSPAARVPGTAVRRDHVFPASAVRSTEPSSSSR